MNGPINMKRCDTSSLSEYLFILKESMMKKKLLIFTMIVPVFVILLTAQADADTDQNKVITFYATSYEESHPPQHCIDKDPRTYWKSGKNSMNEGLQVRLLKPSSISTLKIVTKDKTPRAFELYINGKTFGEIKSDEAILLDEKRVSTLFINVLHDNMSGVEELFIQSPDGRELQFPQYADAKVEASSVLSPASAYAPEQAFDGRLNFSWSEGVEGQGAGQTLSVHFTKKQSIDALYLANGYQRSDTHYRANSRVKNFKLYGDGVLIGDYRAKDQDGFQKISLTQSVNAKNFRLEIVDTYKGDKYADTLISEIVFSYKDTLLAADSGYLLKMSQVYQSSIKGTILESIVGLSLYTHIDTDRSAYASQTSILLLRDNGSFVIYNREQKYGGSEYHKVVYDGNWVINEAGPSKAVIKIFGRSHDSTAKFDYKSYSTEKAKQMVSIFSDTITIERATADNVKDYYNPTLTKSVHKYLRKSSKVKYLFQGTIIKQIYPIDAYEQDWESDDPEVYNNPYIIK